MYLLAVDVILMGLRVLFTKGNILTVLNDFAITVFYILTFIYTPAWWYGFVAMGISLVAGMPVFLLLVKQKQDYTPGKVARLIGLVSTLAAPIVTVFLYLDLFHVI